MDVMNAALYQHVTDKLLSLLERAVQKEMVEYRYQLWLNYKPVPYWGTEREKKS
jgi:hypothetical protein